VRRPHCEAMSGRRLRWEFFAASAAPWVVS
jgi:hypothetical protein